MSQLPFHNPEELERVLGSQSGLPDPGPVQSEALRQYEADAHVPPSLAPDPVLNVRQSDEDIQANVRDIMSQAAEEGDRRRWHQYSSDPVPYTNPLGVVGLSFKGPPHHKKSPWTGGLVEFTYGSEPPPSFMDTLKANFDRELFGFGVYGATHPKFSTVHWPEEAFEFDNEFDPREHLLPDAPYTKRSLDILESAPNELVFYAWHQDILETIRSEEIQIKAGFLKNLFANLIMLPIDPISAVPVIGPTSKAYQGAKLFTRMFRKHPKEMASYLRGLPEDVRLDALNVNMKMRRDLGASMIKPRLLESIGLTAPALVLDEAALQMLDPQRTGMETVANSAATVVFGRGLLGIRDIVHYSRLRRAFKRIKNSGPLPPDPPEWTPGRPIEGPDAPDLSGGGSPGRKHVYSYPTRRKQLGPADPPETKLLGPPDPPEPSLMEKTAFGSQMEFQYPPPRYGHRRGVRGQLSLINELNAESIVSDYHANRERWIEEGAISDREIILLDKLVGQTDQEALTKWKHKRPDLIGQITNYPDWENVTEVVVEDKARFEPTTDDWIPEGRVDVTVHRLNGSSERIARGLTEEELIDLLGRPAAVNALEKIGSLRESGYLVSLKPKDSDADFDVFGSAQRYLKESGQVFDVEISGDELPSLIPSDYKRPVSEEDIAAAAEGYFRLQIERAVQNTVKAVANKFRTPLAKSVTGEQDVFSTRSKHYVDKLWQENNELGEWYDKNLRDLLGDSPEGILYLTSLWNPPKDAGFRTEVSRGFLGQYISGWILAEMKKASDADPSVPKLRERVYTPQRAEMNIPYIHASLMIMDLDKVRAIAIRRASEEFQQRYRRKGSSEHSPSRLSVEEEAKRIRLWTELRDRSRTQAQRDAAEIGMAMAASDHNLVANLLDNMERNLSPIGRRAAGFAGDESFQEAPWGEDFPGIDFQELIAKYEQMRSQELAQLGSDDPLINVDPDFEGINSLTRPSQITEPSIIDESEIPEQLLDDLGVAAIDDIDGPEPDYMAGDSDDIDFSDELSAKPIWDVNQGYPNLEYQDKDFDVILEWAQEYELQAWGTYLMDTATRPSILEEVAGYETMVPRGEKLYPKPEALSQMGMDNWIQANLGLETYTRWLEEENIPAGSMPNQRVREGLGKISHDSPEVVVTGDAHDKDAIAIKTRRSDLVYIPPLYKAAIEEAENVIKGLQSSRDDLALLSPFDVMTKIGLGRRGVIGLFFHQLRALKGKSSSKLILENMMIDNKRVLLDGLDNEIENAKTLLTELLAPTRMDYFGKMSDEYALIATRRELEYLVDLRIRGDRFNPPILDSLGKNLSSADAQLPGHGLGQNEISMGKINNLEGARLVNRIITDYIEASPIEADRPALLLSGSTVPGARDILHIAGVKKAVSMLFLPTRLRDTNGIIDFKSGIFFFPEVILSKFIARDWSMPGISLDSWNLNIVATDQARATGNPFNKASVDWTGQLNKSWIGSDPKHLPYHEHAFRTVEAWTAFVVEHTLMRWQFETAKTSHVDALRYMSDGSPADVETFNQKLAFDAYMRSVGKENNSDRLPFGRCSTCNTDGPQPGSLGEQDTRDDWLSLINFFYRGDLKGSHAAMLDTMGLSHVSQLLNPVLKMVVSPNWLMRDLMKKMFITPYYFKSEADGYPTMAPVETWARMSLGPAYVTLKHHKEQFNAYLKAENLGGFNPFSKEKHYKKFSELVGQALIGDRYKTDPNVNEFVAKSAARYRSDVFDRTLKRALESGLVDQKDVDHIIESNGSYFHRIYDKIKIKGDTKLLDADFSDLSVSNEIATSGSGFAMTLYRYWVGQGIDSKKAFKMAREAQESIMHKPDGTIEPAHSFRGGTKNRLLNVPDEILEPYLVLDIDKVSMNYAKIWGVDVELAREFNGDPTMAAETKALHRVYRDIYTAIERDLPYVWEDKKGRVFSDIGPNRDGIISDPDAVPVEATGGTANVTRNAETGAWTVRRFEGESFEGAKGKTAAEVKAKALETIKGLQEKEMQTFDNLKTLLRGMDNLPDDPEDVIHRLPSMVRNFAYMAQSGYFVIANIPDAANGVSLFGMHRVFRDGWVPYIQNLRGLKMTKEEANNLAIAVEMIRSLVIHEMIGTQDQYGRQMNRSDSHSTTSLLKRLFNFSEDMSFAGASVANIINLMGPFADVVQMVNYLTAQRYILDAAELVSSGGKMSPEMVLRVSKMGLDVEGLKEIHNQFKTHGKLTGKKEDVPFANVQAWEGTPEGEKAARLFTGALGVAHNILTVAPGVGDRPTGKIKTPLGDLGFQTNLGKMFTMYTGYGFAAMTRVAGMKLQQKDSAALQGFVMAMGLGALVTSLRSIASGKDMPDDPVEWVSESVDRSGLLGWLVNADMLLGIVTDGNVGINAWTSHPNAEFSAGAMLSAATGGAGSWMKSAASSLWGIADHDFGGEVDPSTVRSIKETLPYTNLFYMRFLLEMMAGEPVTEGASGYSAFDDRNVMGTVSRAVAHKMKTDGQAPPEDLSDFLDWWKNKHGGEQLTKERASDRFSPR